MCPNDWNVSTCCMLVWECVGGHMQVCVWSTEDRLRCHSSAVLIHLDLGDRVCHWPKMHWSGRLAGSSGIPRYWTVSTSSALELEECATMPGFFTWVLGVRLSSPLLHGKHSVNGAIFPAWKAEDFNDHQPLLPFPATCCSYSTRSSYEQPFIMVWFFKGIYGKKSQSIEKVCCDFRAVSSFLSFFKGERPMVSIFWKFILLQSNG